MGIPLVYLNTVGTPFNVPQFKVFHHLMFIFNAPITIIPSTNPSWDTDLPEDFHSFLQYLQENAGEYHKLGDVHVLPHPFQFTLSSDYSSCYKPKVTESIINLKR
jgi:hypothetical protein